MLYIVLFVNGKYIGYVKHFELLSGVALDKNDLLLCGIAVPEILC